MRKPKVFMRPYEHFSQAELATELREKAAELLEQAKTARTVVEAWANGVIDKPFDFKMFRVCRFTVGKARLLRHAAREAHARGLSAPRNI